jgi:hypothetical protein
VPSEQIRLVHLTGGIRHSPHSDNPTNDPALTVTRYLSLYWQSRILTSLETLEADCTEDTIADRRATAEQVQSVAISIAEMYELDAVFAQCAQELASALN